MRVTNIDQFTSKAKSIHSGRYDYSKSLYVRSIEKIEILCPRHGSFWQTPNSHLAGHGCIDCAGKKPKDTDWLIRRGREMYGLAHRYDKTEYLNYDAKVVITCLVHGDFSVTPGNYLKGFHCRECSGKRAELTLPLFIERATAVHGDRYDYSQSVVGGAHDKVKIICRSHGLFSMTFSNHTNSGQGCPVCAEYGFKSHQPATLYYIKIEAESGPIFKVGITNKNGARKRFYGMRDLGRVTVLFERRFSIGRHAKKMESVIKRRGLPYRYQGAPILSCKGTTEMFTADILTELPRLAEIFTKRKSTCDGAIAA